jgi:chlorite dismutase
MSDRPAASHPHAAPADTAPAHAGETASPQVPDLREKGGPKDGKPQVLDARLFMQLLVFTGCSDTRPLIAKLEQSGLGGVLYEDLNHPRGIALLTWSQNPDFFVQTLRPLLNAEPFAALCLRDAFTMFGRTYAIGYEPDLHDWLIEHPQRVALDAAWPWAVWYPLRRKGSFEQLDERQQRAILGEHGRIGRAFGAADLVRDIRLASFGLDTFDNDFVIGLSGRELHPLSAVVQAMRKTTQTSQHLEKLGPFFIGRAVWQRRPQ